jgi:hypothetical protein
MKTANIKMSRVKVSHVFYDGHSTARDEIKLTDPEIHYYEQASSFLYQLTTILLLFISIG